MTRKQTDMEDIAGAIQGLATLMDERFDQVDQRFEKIDQRFEKIDQRFDQVDQRFEQIDQRFDNLDGEIRSIREEQRQMRQWLERIDSHLSGMESDIKEIYDRITAFEKRAPNLTKQELAELQRNMNELMAWAKQVSVKTGVPLPKT